MLAVAMYPLHRAVARRIGGKQGLAATSITVLAVALIVVPTAISLSSLGDSVHQLIADVQQGTLQILHRASASRTGSSGLLVHSLQPKFGELAKGALAMVASIGGGILQFLAALIIAGIIMAFGEAGIAPAARSSSA